MSEGRLGSLDAFRGATIAAMLLVNNPGSWAHIYAPLRHAAWHGWTVTDLIFPFFLFVVGITTHLAIERRIDTGGDSRAIRIRVVRRGVTIILLGLFLNGFPFFATGAIPEIPTPSVLDRIVHQFVTLRFPGVLQRIGVVYLFVGLFATRGDRDRTSSLVRPREVGLLGAILGGYWALLTLVPVPGSGVSGWVVLGTPEETIAAWSDRFVFGVQHLWSQSKMWDPEGALSTIPAVATALSGVIAGRWLSSSRTVVDKAKGLVSFGVGFVAVGWFWGLAFPINKNLWTSSYVVFTTGAACLGLAAAMWVVDIRGWKRLAAPSIAYGVNPMLAFVGSGIMARLLTLIRVDWGGREVSLKYFIHDTLFAWLPDKPASLMFALTIVLVWLAILWPLWKKGIVLKV